MRSPESQCATSNSCHISKIDGEIYWRPNYTGCSHIFGIDAKSMYWRITTLLNTSRPYFCIDGRPPCQAMGTRYSCGKQHTGVHGLRGIHEHDWDSYDKSIHEMVYPHSQAATVSVKLYGIVTPSNLHTVETCVYGDLAPRWGGTGRIHLSNQWLEQSSNMTIRLSHKFSLTGRMEQGQPLCGPGTRINQWTNTLIDWDKSELREGVLYRRGSIYNETISWSCYKH